MAMRSSPAALILEKVILASASRTRLNMLESAGFAVEADPARVDEHELKRSYLAEGAGGARIAEVLAELKAETVSRRHPGCLVIGADQVLECEGTVFDKPPTREAAARQLACLSGREHELVSAVCVFRDGRRLWHGVDRARLRMRALSDEFIDSYLAAAGDGIVDGPGAYRIEELGSHLFEEIDGDYFTVLGLPLLPLLGFLGQHGAVRT